MSEKDPRNFLSELEEPRYDRVEKRRKKVAFTKEQQERMKLRMVRVDMWVPVDATQQAVLDAVDEALVLRFGQLKPSAFVYDSAGDPGAQPV